MQIRTVVVGLLAGMLVVTALPVARAAMDRPTWTVGDYWAYRFSVTQYPYGTMNGTLRMDVTGTENVVAGDATYATFAVSSVMNMTFGGQSATLTLDVWHRTSDLAIVKEAMDQSYGGYQLTIRMTYDPPIEIRWPLVPGATWSASSSVLLESRDPFGGWYNSTSTVTGSFSVQNETQITVPAGTFLAIGMHRNEGGMFAGSGATEYWSSAVGNAVRIVPEGSGAPTFDLTEYHYVATSWPWSLVTIAAIVLPIALVGALLLRAMRRRAPPTATPPQAFGPAPPTQESIVQPWQPPQPPPGT